MAAEEEEKEEEEEDDDEKAKKGIFYTKQLRFGKRGNSVQKTLTCTPHG